MLKNFRSTKRRCVLRFFIGNSRRAQPHTSAQICAPRSTALWAGGIGAPCPPCPETRQPLPLWVSRCRVRGFPTLGGSAPASCYVPPRVPVPCGTGALLPVPPVSVPRGRPRAGGHFACHPDTRARPLSHPPRSTPQGRATANDFALRASTLADARPCSVPLPPCTKMLRARVLLRTDTRNRVTPSSYTDPCVSPPRTRALRYHPDTRAGYMLVEDAGRHFVRAAPSHPAATTSSIAAAWVA